MESKSTFTLRFPRMGVYIGDVEDMINAKKVDRWVRVVKVNHKGLAVVALEVDRTWAKEEKNFNLVYDLVDEVWEIRDVVKAEIKNRLNLLTRFSLDLLAIGTYPEDKAKVDGYIESYNQQLNKF